MTGRGILAGSVGAVAGCAVGGGLGWAVYAGIDPILGGRGDWLEELQGLVTSVVLLGAGAGLAIGCLVALRCRGHAAAGLTALLVLGIVPFLTPLVALAGRLGWQTALAVGIVLVTSAVAVVRLLVASTGGDHHLEVPRSPEATGR